MAGWIVGRMKFGIVPLSCFVVLAVAAVPGAMGQTPAPAKAAAPARPMAFDVVSIRQNVAGSVHDDFGPTPDGFRIVNNSLMLAIMTAYVPQSSDTALFTPDRMNGLPEWAQGERYDIVAKVSEADLAEWENPALQPAMLRAMMQTMLADRFKLVEHREMKEVAVYSLVVGKNGPKFKETDPAEPHPNARKFLGGSVIAMENQGHSIHFYDASMATLGSVLSGFDARPVVDETGLAGRYDFVLQKPEPSALTAGPQEAAEPAPTIFSVVEALGLKLVPAKASVETLVIDHMERPSAN